MVGFTLVLFGVLTLKFLLIFTVHSCESDFGGSEFKLPLEGSFIGLHLKGKLTKAEDLMLVEPFALQMLVLEFIIWKSFFSGFRLNCKLFEADLRIET